MYDRVTRPRRSLLGGSARDQWGTKVIAAELTVAAAIEPFAVNPVPGVQWTIADSIAHAIANRNNAGYVAGDIAWSIKNFPAAERAAVWNQLGDVVGAGFIRLIGKLVGV